ncbi:efflux RND transporter periplasmic adaptor subunit [Phyllobacterium myrsinacearum]|uniref:Macrolide-specific efflux system membrane fusion protein n=1 Tax=Phyllobacterium myrsinacearum TaxID=28101 RepID=A0A839EKB1_9HYPH|nr:efflux RND transporter periplasmic adaptor subunit [Phyllobacterium myrsinacearum]MBA8879302.1 macrolide-specific efflux system membrane fusion protein [Phyllobacterium myrsinacearum]
MKLPKLFWRRAVGIVLIAGAAYVIAAMTGMLGGKPQISVLTAPITVGSIEETVLANGVLEPARMVNVGAQVSGKINALHVELGQKVKNGDLIAEIDPLPQKNALRIAEATFAKVTAQHKARTIQLRQAEAVYLRQVKLVRQNAVAELKSEAAESEYKALEADVAALAAQIDQAGIEVENAQVNLGYTRIAAPIDGVVIAVVTKQGQTLNSTQSVPTIVVLAQLDVMRLKVQISEADIGRVKTGQRAWFKILGDQQTRLEAVLGQIEPAPVSMSTEAGLQASANAQANTAIYYNGLFDVPNPAGRLRPLMTAQVDIVLGEKVDVPLIPWSALSEQEVDGRYRVRVKTADGKLLWRIVTVGISNKVQVQLVSGLSAGDEVVIRADGPLSDPMAGASI